ncbi:hypothetical protein BLA29_003694 [Euroglyphus maynei]|uniref:Iron-binding zinc finger CDGSH type domain-containing protein n=1 Tax=Euroglyphus maynei TaxID=6958 RepID=A0A1Y3BTF7_EURMA|nr:hypothetical protein BLA29_003694 [Euroglyphus maynei]
MIGYEVLPWLTTALAVCYGLYLTYKTSSCCGKNDKVNRQIDPGNAKVVHSFDIEDLDEKAVFCRCWKSAKFPYCDGSHNKHNETTGDNVGPLIIQKK